MKNPLKYIAERCKGFLNFHYRFAGDHDEADRMQIEEQGRGYVAPKPEERIDDDLEGITEEDMEDVARKLMELGYL